MHTALDQKSRLQLTLSHANRPCSNRETPIRYMGAGENVLWELQPAPQSDMAFHCGADISMLSQFAGEDEGALTAAILNAAQ